jgi:signal transduction histidine kinase
MSYPAGDRPLAYPAYPGSGPRLPRPPLTKRMRAGHWIAVDCVVGGFAALCAAAVVGRNLPPGHFKVAIAALFTAGVFLPLALRRRAPVSAFGILLILGVLLSGLPTAVSALIFLAATFVLYTVTVEGRRRTGIAALALMLAVLVSLAVAEHARPDGAAGVLVPVALASVIAWMTGYSVRQRRRYVVTLQQQAASRAVTDERLRIARELHDVVAHSMSVIAVQAGYGQYVIARDPDGAREALGAIQATSRDALDEMRRMLGVLREPGQQVPGPAGTEPAPAQPVPDRPQPASAPLAPAPGLAGLDRLIGRTRGAGVQVTREVHGPVRPVPAGIDLSAYRIIQEALTNVVKHAGSGVVCAVSVGYTDAELVIRVTDEGGPDARVAPGGSAGGGTGHGIIGMRERVNLCGGTFGAGPLPVGGFQVTASLPLPAPSPATETAGPASGPDTLSVPAGAAVRDPAGVTEGGQG